MTNQLRYNYFKELTINDGHVEEMDIPEYIRRLCKKPASH